MENKKQVLSISLQQIIQTDKQAEEILQQAKTKNDEIVRQTSVEKAEILKDASTRRQEMIRQVEAEEEAELSKTRQELAARFEGQKQGLEQDVQQHREEWISGIVSRIVGAE